MKIRYFLPLLALAPGAYAQSTGPDIRADSTRESSAIEKGSADTTKPGATGKTVVPGNNSTVAGDNSSTVRAKSTGTGGGSK